jgi:hypothetical protein
MADRTAIISPMGTASTPSIASSTTALAENKVRGAWIIQNLGTNALFVRLGAGASTTVFTVVLKAGTGNDDGSGGTFAQESGVIYTGIISVAGTSPRYTITELTA